MIINAGRREFKELFLASDRSANNILWAQAIRRDQSRFSDRKRAKQDEKLVPDNIEIRADFKVDSAPIDQYHDGHVYRWFSQDEKA